MSHLLKRQKKNLSKVKPVLSDNSKRTPKSLLTVSRRYFFCGSLCVLCFVFALPLCVSVYMCLMVTCWERTDLSALVCGVLLWVCHFPIGILGQVWYLIVSIPDLCTLTYFKYKLSLNAGQKYWRMFQGEHSAVLSTSIKLHFSIKTFVLYTFKRPLKTGFTTLGRSEPKLLIINRISA